MNIPTNIDRAKGLEFIQTCRNQGHPDAFIQAQMNLFSQGVRDVRLHDNCIILF